MGPISSWQTVSNVVNSIISRCGKSNIEQQADKRASGVYVAKLQLKFEADGQLVERSLVVSCVVRSARGRVRVEHSAKLYDLIPQKPQLETAPQIEQELKAMKGIISTYHLNTKVPMVLAICLINCSGREEGLGVVRW
jgi:hypothetical protein